MARNTARHTAEHILSSTPEWKKPPLYDVVYRIPEASLKLARDDRQAGLWYREERKNAENGTEHPKDHRPVISLASAACALPRARPAAHRWPPLRPHPCNFAPPPPRAGRAHVGEHLPQRQGAQRARGRVRPGPGPQGRGPGCPQQQLGPGRVRPAPGRQYSAAEAPPPALASAFAGRDSGPTGRFVSPAGASDSGVAPTPDAGT